jgi:hypothetical protein
MAMTWGQIKATVAGYANRTDLSSMMPTFLELAEQRIYNGGAEGQVPPLRLSNMLTTVSPASLLLPADFIEMKRVVAIMDPTQKKALDFKPLEVMGAMETAAGTPQYYSLQNSTLVYAPTFSYPVEIIYYARFPALVNDLDSNWLTSNASTAYISAMLIEVGYYLRDNDLSQRELARFASSVNAMQAQDDGNKHSGAQLRMIQDAPRII